MRNILRRPRPRPEGAAAAAAKAPQDSKPRQIVARYPNHVWSVDRTRVWRWRIWPTWVLVAIDHFSRKVVACCALEGPNAGWVTGALEEAFSQQGAPRHLITDQEGVFTGEAMAELLTEWDVRQRFGAVGKHGSIAVTERLIRKLKHEWLKRVPVIRGDRSPGATAGRLRLLLQLLAAALHPEWRGAGSGPCRAGMVGPGPHSEDRACSHRAPLLLRDSHHGLPTRSVAETTDCPLFVSRPPARSPRTPPESASPRLRAHPGPIYGRHSTAPGVGCC